MNTQLFYEAVEGYKAEVLGASNFTGAPGGAEPRGVAGAMTSFSDDNVTPQDEMFTLADNPEGTASSADVSYNFAEFPDTATYSIGDFSYSESITDIPIVNIRDKANLTPVLADYVRFNNELIDPAYRKQGVFGDIFEYIRYVEDFNYRYLLDEEELDYKKVISDFILTTYGILADPEVYGNLAEDDLDLVRALAFPYRLVTMEDYNAIKDCYKENWFNVHLLHNASIRPNVTALMCQCMQRGVNWDTLLEFIPLDATEPEAYKHALELALSGCTDFTEYRAAVSNHTSKAFMANRDLTIQNSNLPEKAEDLVAKTMTQEANSTMPTSNPDFSSMTSTEFELDDNFDLGADLDLTDSLEAALMSVSDLDLDTGLGSGSVATPVPSAAPEPTPVTTPEPAATPVPTAAPINKYAGHPGYKWIQKLLPKMSESEIDALLQQPYPAIRLVLLADNNATVEVSNDVELGHYYAFIDQVAYDLDISSLLDKSPQEVCYDLLVNNALLDIDYAAITQQYPDFINALIKAYVKHFISYKDFMCYWYVFARNPGFYKELGGSVKSVNRFIANKLLPSTENSTTPKIKNIVVGFRSAQTTDYEIVTAMNVYDAMKNYASIKYLVARGEPVRFNEDTGVLTIGNVPATEIYIKSSFSEWLDNGIMKGKKVQLGVIDTLNAQNAIAGGVSRDRVVEFQKLFKDHEIYSHSLDCMLSMITNNTVLQVAKEASTLGYLLARLNEKVLTKSVTLADVVNTLVLLSSSAKYTGKTYNIVSNPVGDNVSITSILAKYQTNGKVYEWRLNVREFITAGCYTLFSGLYNFGIKQAKLSVTNNELLIDATIGGV